MKANLLLICFFLLFALGQALPESIKDNQQDMQCAYLSAYFEGTFRNPKDWSKTVDAQFQIKINSYAPSQEVLLVNYWNSTLASENNVHLELNTANSARYCTNFNESCVIAFDGNSKWLTLSLMNEYPWFWFHLFQLSPGQWFTLPNAYNGCTKTLPPSTAIADSPDNQADPSLYSYCACCGEYKPDPLLGCPVSPLQKHKSKVLEERPQPPPATKAPSTPPPATKAPSTPPPATKVPSTPPPSKKDQLTCNSVTVFYTGIFQHDHEDPWFAARFQNRYELDVRNRRVIFTNQKWDTTLSNQDNFLFVLSNSTDWAFCNPLQEGCSIHYNEQTAYIATHVKSLSPTSEHNLFFQYGASDGFVLNNVVGKCTNTPIEDPGYGGNFNPNEYRVCACCGDYAPDPSLLCPANPWQTHT